MRAMYENMHPGAKMLVFVGMIALCTGVFTMLSFFAAMPLFDVNLLTNPAMLDNLSDPKSINVLKFIQMVSQLSMMIIPSLLAGFLFSNNAAKYLCGDKKVQFTPALLVVISIVAAGPLINFLLMVNQGLKLPAALSGIETWIMDYETKAQVLTEAFLKDTSTTALFINLLMMGVLPAIGEEFLFRGVMQKLFYQLLNKKILAVVITAFIFSAIHLQFYGFLPRFLLGVYFGMLLVWSRNIWLTIIAHFTNNTLAVILSALYSQNKLAFNPDTIGTESGEMLWVILSVFITTGCTWVLYRKTQQDHNLKPETSS